jgi:hypothetical protein
VETDTEEEEVLDETSDGTEGTAYSSSLITCIRREVHPCPALLHLPTSSLEHLALRPAGGTLQSTQKENLHPYITLQSLLDFGGILQNR